MLGSLVQTALAIAGLFGTLIFVHELGHLLAAKWVGIRVHAFGIGFGPKLFAFRWGGTEYRLCPIPLGGYVQPEEEPGAAGSMRDKTPAARIFVMSAGVIMNALLAILLFAVVGWSRGEPAPEPARLLVIDRAALPAGASALAEIPTGSRMVRYQGEEIEDWNGFRMAVLLGGGGTSVLEFEGGEQVELTLPERGEERAELFQAIIPAHSSNVTSIEPGSPAAAAGLLAGDRIIAVDTLPVRYAIQVAALMARRPETTSALSVVRGADTLRLAVTPEARPAAEGSTEVYGWIGVGMQPPNQRLSPIASLSYGVRESWNWTVTTVKSIVGMANGRVSPRDMGGPVMVGQATHQVIQVGWEAFLLLMAILSINLAVLNLIPIPILDGGQILLTSIEWVRGRRLAPVWEGRVMNVGYVCVALLMVWALGNDFLRLLGV